MARGLVDGNGVCRYEQSSYVTIKLIMVCRTAYLKENKSSVHHSDPVEEKVHEAESAAISPPKLDEVKTGCSDKSKSNSHGIEPCFKWTKTHGFFLQMGGFMLYENGQNQHVLGWETLMEYYKAGRIDLSTITEASINDRSKADGFSKGLALLQIVWFIIQSLARFSTKRLALTEIELVTAALAILSLVMYFLWWNKPFNAEIPIFISLCEPDSQSVESNLARKGENFLHIPFMNL